MNSDATPHCTANKSAVLSIRIDAGLLQQILANLLSNSIKYSPQGGSILCRLEIDTNQLRFRCEIQGLAFPMPNNPNCSDRSTAPAMPLGLLTQV
ncbi:ATP-binding protein [Leptolyngbya sp. FACHB-17]|uniref:ATP-binding protein n=1 Tax=unclassified Leptolyngbya TaxID=2650499 RepID=UPI0016807906|nr:ATP-binding protein [Leptolyngbya sp. FACHB-17]MBD2082524.1 hypothetical protein [Leptolyngbya sp. FACHB-17]